MDKIVIRLAKGSDEPLLNFVEIEDVNGKSIKVGEWSKDGEYDLITIPMNQIGEREIGLNREKLANLLRGFIEDKCYCFDILDAIIAQENNLIEVKNGTDSITNK